ncbi:hypothetical protein AVEN_260160-1 [Araneus ventricosus]|uniref:Uncharacterized protein n=1 Tax=Araneus ventricosus TaxID=182803 RepID=A0A4Y2DPR3_ARAVE|nr:hypothetical protein AVEN_260160-1 [Araneus ventricosus]
MGKNLSFFVLCCGLRREIPRNYEYKQIKRNGAKQPKRIFQAEKLQLVDIKESSKAAQPLRIDYASERHEAEFVTTLPVKKRGKIWLEKPNSFSQVADTVSG